MTVPVGGDKIYIKPSDFEFSGHASVPDLIQFDAEEQAKVDAWLLSQVARTAAVVVSEGGSGNPYHCPAGTGLTSGRFTDSIGSSCNPMVNQLSSKGLESRMSQLQKALKADGVSNERRARLEEEMRLVEVEAARRADPNQPEGMGISVEPNEVPIATVGTRLPDSSAKSKEAQNLPRSLDPGLIIDFEDEKTRALLEKWFGQYAQSVPGLQGMGFDEAMKFYEDNLVAVFESGLDRYMMAEMIDGAPHTPLATLDEALDRIGVDSMWYPAAHNYARDLALDFDVPPAVAVQAIAVLSPTSDWDTNVVNAERTLRAITEDWAITDADAELVNVELGYAAVEEGMRLSEMDAMVAGRSIASMFRGRVETDKGVVLRERTGSRYQDEHALVDSMVVLPGGDYKFVERLTNKGEQMFAASKSSREYESVVRTMRVVQDEDATPEDMLTEISRGLGLGHKVRTFYRNIADPWTMTDQTVTIDSHSFSSGLGYGIGSGTEILRPEALGGMVGPQRDRVPGDEKVNMYKSLGQFGTNVNGFQSTYGMMQEAMVRATDRINEQYGTEFRPSQMQSMTWVEHRRRWPSDARSEASTAEMAALMFEWEQSGHDPEVGERVWAEIDEIRLRDIAAMEERANAN